MPQGPWVFPGTPSTGPVLGLPKFPPIPRGIQCTSSLPLESLEALSSFYAPPCSTPLSSHVIHCVLTFPKISGAWIRMRNEGRPLCSWATWLNPVGALKIMAVLTLPTAQEWIGLPCFFNRSSREFWTTTEPSKTCIREAEQASLFLGNVAWS